MIDTNKYVVIDNTSLRSGGSPLHAVSDGRFVTVTASKPYGNNENTVTQTSHRDPYGGGELRTLIRDASVQRQEASARWTPQRAALPLFLGEEGTASSAEVRLKKLKTESDEYANREVAGRADRKGSTP